MEMIHEECQQVTTQYGVLHRFHYCHYSGTTNDIPVEDIEKIIAKSILSELAGGDDRAIEIFLPYALEISRSPDILISNDYPSVAPGWIASNLEAIANTLVEFNALAHVVSDKLRGNDSLGGQSQVLLVLVDDLDHCEYRYLWKVLDAIQRFRPIPNMFFILSVDHQHLTSALQEKFSLAKHPVDSDSAVEKYVQYAISIPEMDKQLLQRFVDNLVLAVYPDDNFGATIRQSVAFIQHAIKDPITPRSIKVLLNKLSMDLNRELFDGWDIVERQRMIKIRLLEYTWPDFHSLLIMNVNSKDGLEPIKAALIELETACSEFAESMDETILNVALEQILKVFGINWMRIPTRLARFLGTSPFLFYSGRIQKGATEILRQT